MALMSFLVWIILNGKITVEIVLIGAVITVLAWIFARRYLGWSIRKELCLYLILPRVILYLVELTYEIVRASVSVSGYIIRKENPDAVIVKFNSGLSRQVTNAVLANSITLTPGTITVEEHGGTFEVCCLAPRYAEGIEEMHLIKSLKKIELTVNGILGACKS